MYISENLERKIWKVKDFLESVSYKWWRLMHKKEAKKYEEQMEAWFKKLQK